MLNNKEVYDKLMEVSTKINQAVKSYADGEIIVEKFVNDLWAIHSKLNSLNYENAQAIRQDPKLTRITRTLFEEIFKYLNQHINTKPNKEEKEEEIFF